MMSFDILALRPPFRPDEEPVEFVDKTCPIQAKESE